MIDTTQPGTCRGCGQTVYWRTEKSGKANPYNAPEPCKQCGGNGPDCKRCEGTGTMQVSHFGTCPKAADFRRKP